jgi:hypothetical protein
MASELQRLEVEIEEFARMVGLEDAKAAEASLYERFLRPPVKGGICSGTRWPPSGWPIS